MSNTNENIAINSTNQEENSSFLENLDLSKIRSIVLKSLIWIILIHIGIISLAFLYLKYQKPLYQSNSILKLTVENEKIVSNLDLFDNKRDNGGSNLLGEIEFARSNIVLGSVANFLKPLKISYYSKGNFVDKEMYKYNPFFVAFHEHKKFSLYDKKIELRILNNNEFTIKLNKSTKRYNFNQPIRILGEKISINKSPNFGKEFIGLNYYFIINSEESTINFLKRNLIVGEQNRNAQTFLIGFKEHDPAKARDIVSAIDSIYIEKTREERNKSNSLTLTFLEEKINEYKDSLQKYERLVQTFFVQNKTRDINSKVEKAIADLESFSRKRAAVNQKLSTLSEIQSILNDEKGFINNQYLLYQAESPEIQNILSQFREKLQEKERLLNRVKDNNNTTKLQSLNNELNHIRQSVYGVIGASKSIIRAQLSEINNRMGEAQSILHNLPTKESDFSNINQQYTVYKQYYDQFFNQRIALLVAQAGVIPKSILLTPANLPTKSIGTSSFIIYAVAVFISVFLSGGVIFLRYLMHDYVTNQKELEKFLKAPILGIIPKYRGEKLEHTKLVVQTNKKTSFGEAITNIRTNIDFMLPNGLSLRNKDNPPILSVTSTISGEGKTFVAANLGAVISMADIKVVILDFDMRKPKLHLAFGQENSKGVSTTLIGKTNIKDCIQHTKMESLDFISSGPIPPNPSELILREEFDLMLSDLKKIYDVIIIDTPPVGLVTDAMLIMKKIDLPMYIVKANYSRKPFIRNINRLYNKEVKNISVILNAVKPTKSYGNYGGYYGGYGSSYYTEDENHKRGLISRIKHLFTFKKK